MSERRRGSLNEILSGQLYQRGQFLSWPHAQKMRLLEEHKIHTVFNLWHKVDPDLSPTELNITYITWLCSPSHVPMGAEEMIHLACKRLKYGAVLIHCEAGRGRSVWFSTRVLAQFKCIPRHEAWEQIKLACPGHKLTPTLLEDLK